MRSRSLGVGLCLGLVVTVAAGCSDSGSDGTPTATPRHVPTVPIDLHGGLVTSPIVIQRGTRETFTPPLAGLTPRLSGVQAWRAVQMMGGRNRRKIQPIPATTTYQLGLLTLPPQHNDELAWGFRSGPGGCVYSTAPTAPQPKPRQCYNWQFLSARTGRFLEGTQQPVGLTGKTPAPVPTSQLLAAGFIPAQLSRFAPTELDFAAPQTVVGWTWEETRCQIDLHWFLPPESQAVKVGGRPCEWRHRFSIDAVSTVASRGRVFTLVAGHQAHRYGELVRATLSNGQTATFQGEDGAWVFVVQRCGTSYDGTGVAKVEEIDAKTKRVITGLPVAPTLAAATPTVADCVA
jgi:hypothetical protein